MNGNPEPACEIRASRSKEIAKNVVGIFIARGISFGANLAIVPLSLHYLGTTRYGVWMTMSSVVTWVGMLDLGIGNGLRNKLAESLAQKDLQLSREYVSTAFAFLGLAAGVGVAFFLALNPFLSWVALLNAPASMEADLTTVAAIVFGLWGVRLGVGLVSSVLLADQRPAASSLLDTLAAVLTYLSILVLKNTDASSFVWFGIASSFFQSLIPLTAVIIVFNGRYHDIRPTWHSVRPVFARDLVSLGAKFFFLQLAAIVLFSTGNILIAHLFGPAEVAPFAIALRYFGAPLSAFAVILVPYWSAYTQAYVRREFAWIQSSMRKLRQLLLLLVFGVCAMTIIAPNVYELWLGKEIHIPWPLSVFAGLYVIMASWCGIYVNLINGAGKVRLQMVVAGLSVVAFLPVAIFLGSVISLRSAGVMLAICIVLLPSCILWPRQATMLLEGRAQGIWGE